MSAYSLFAQANLVDGVILTLGEDQARAFARRQNIFLQVYVVDLIPQRRRHIDRFLF
ncbi:hypothetical protein D3C76_1345090 [compost metagenome]